VPSEDGKIPVIKCGVVGQAPCKSTPLPAIQWTSWCQAAGLADWRPKPAYTYNDSNLEVEAARLGHGIALSRLSLVSAAIAAGSLVKITEIEVPYQYPYWLIWPEKSSSSRKLADFSA